MVLNGDKVHIQAGMYEFRWWSSIDWENELRFRNATEKWSGMTDWTWVRSIVESEFKSYVRARLPVIICCGLASVCKVIKF